MRILSSHHHQVILDGVRYTIFLRLRDASTAIRNPFSVLWSTSCHSADRTLKLANATAALVMKTTSTLVSASAGTCLVASLTAPTLIPRKCDKSKLHPCLYRLVVTPRSYKRRRIPSTTHSSLRPSFEADTIIPYIHCRTTIHCSIQLHSL